MIVFKKTDPRPLDPEDDGIQDEAELRRLGLYDQHRQCLVDAMPPEAEPKIYLFGNGQLLLDIDGGSVMLDRADTVKLYMLFNRDRVKDLMLGVLRADLIEAGHGELMEEVLTMAKTLTPDQRELVLKALA